MQLACVAMLMLSPGAGLCTEVCDDDDDDEDQEEDDNNNKHKKLPKLVN